MQSTVTAAAPLIRLQGLSKVFHTDEVETHALAEIALDIAPGDFVAITGPSGCGKSTLLSILGLLDAPSHGDYLLQGRNVAELSARARARVRNDDIGFIFQAFNLIADLTVEENVALPLTYRDGIAAATIRQRVREVLELVGMQHRQRHYPGQLSGGQQQRVAVARALVGEPAILLADEPTGNLDTRNGESVMQLLEQLNLTGTTLCMVTHDPAFARRASRIVHMLDGRIVDEDTFERLRHEQDSLLPTLAAEPSL
ncbi:putative ABC transport system ATP-binding protein [Xanthomonas campestris]|uniref:ABC transporter ATP-binding protein n=1 Tax=Xanthomonas campestris pv. papavericola TaxID=487881 RepID=A0AAJ3CF14_XANCA|nr:MULTISPECIES: ABC transporter ATP-binding protein [Xanthomonas]MEB2187991.1 ABC transporter ATP-binding protein [Xanthomonas campestris pv. campestris]MCC5083629.1 ABC transporter ATP-binding protein [Xanthomonas campestris]MCS3845585.1 putative ABC transport system ATP-binding protein [Xanthomonas campestris]MEB2233967.1 ABC transporter ATP-binding protein [Xanthomonas campestris pv. campestris]MEC3888695.1 ABC transporter ATP-binding protein [Xanthomonas campestris pv. papavericola]